MSAALALAAATWATDAAAQEWIHGGELRRVLALLAGGRPTSPPIDMSVGARRILASIAAGEPTPAARILLEELERAEPVAPRLYRGTVMSERSARDTFRVGRTVTLPLTSWSTSERVAEGFARTTPDALEWRTNVRGERPPRDAVGVRMTLEAGARAVRLVDLLLPGRYRSALERGLERDPLDPSRAWHDPGCREYVAAGEFDVLEVGTATAAISVRLRSTTLRFRGPDWSITAATIPEGAPTEAGAIACQRCGHARAVHDPCSQCAGPEQEPCVEFIAPETAS